MKRLAKVGAGVSRDPWLWSIIVGAFVLRIAGIGYGLPLWVVADEPPFILGALQMLQTKTLIPALHPEAFKTILYYPPYLSYLYLAPFALIIGVEMLLWHGSSALFASHLLSDLTPFFLLARLINIVLATASVYLVYRIAQFLFTSTIAARVAAFLLGSSLMHVGMSSVARHWMPTFFIFTLVVYVLTRPGIEEHKRYFFSLLFAGVGAGIDTTAVLCLLPAVWWCLTHGQIPFFNLLRNKLLLFGGALFVFLFFLPTVLHTGGNGFLSNVTLTQSKSLLSLTTSPLQAILYSIYSEPVLIGLFLVGLLLVLTERPKLFLWAIGWSVSYTAVFYVFFRLEPRFFLPLTLLYALVGGYAFARLYALHKVVGIVLCILLLIPLISAARLSQLAFVGDTRALAREWVLSSLTPQDKIVVFASLTRLPAQVSAVDELHEIDPTAVRKVDEADAALQRTDIPHALNLYAVTDQAFFTRLPSYVRTHQYRYLLYQSSYASTTPEEAQAFTTLIRDARSVVSRQGMNGFSIADSVFTAPFTELFSGRTLGPTSIVYQLP
jgi:hypothetical protein